MFFFCVMKKNDQAAVCKLHHVSETEGMKSTSQPWACMEKCEYIHTTLQRKARKNRTKVCDDS